MNLKDVKVGDTLFIVEKDARRTQMKWLAPVEKVGRKWITVSLYGNSTEQFDIETGYHKAWQYSPRYKAWLTEQDYLKEQERNSLYREISSLFVWPPKVELGNLAENHTTHIRIWQMNTATTTRPTLSEFTIGLYRNLNDWMLDAMLNEQQQNTSGLISWVVITGCLATLGGLGALIAWIV